MDKKEALLSISDMIWKIVNEEYWRFPKSVISKRDLYQIGMLEASKLYDRWDFSKSKFTTTKKFIWGTIVSYARKFKSEDIHHLELYLNSTFQKIPTNQSSFEVSEELKVKLQKILNDLTPRQRDVVESRSGISGMSLREWKEKYNLSHTVYYREWYKFKNNVCKNHPELREYLHA